MTPEGRIVCEEKIRTKEKLPPEIYESFEIIFNGLYGKEILLFMQEFLALIEEREEPIAMEEIEEKRRAIMELNIHAFCRCC